MYMYMFDVDLESLFGRVDSSIGPSSNYHDLHVIPWTPSLSMPRGLEVACYSAEIEFLIEPFCGFYFVCVCVCVMLSGFWLSK